MCLGRAKGAVWEGMCDEVLTCIWWEEGGNVVSVMIGVGGVMFEKAGVRDSKM